MSYIEPEALSRALAELARQGPIRLELTPLEAWMLLSQLQLALRHPENTGPSAETARVIARQLQEVVAGEGVLKDLAEEGW